MPRPRIHGTSADRQRAYRERLKERTIEAISRQPGLTISEARAQLPRFPAAQSMLDALLYHERVSLEVAVAKVREQWGTAES